MNIKKAYLNELANEIKVTYDELQRLNGAQKRHNTDCIDEVKCVYCGRTYDMSKRGTCDGCGAPRNTMKPLYGRI